MDSENFNNNIKDILITEQEIKLNTAKAGKYISSLYDGRPILLAGILKGSFMFLADLARNVDVPCEIGFMAAESYYDNTESSGQVNITMDLQQDISGYHVVIAEDIIDTGRTLKAVSDILKARNPLSFTIITLLDKPDRRTADINADMSLFTIPDKFVVGYGLDYCGYYRNLPYIAELDCGKFSKSL